MLDLQALAMQSQGNHGINPQITDARLPGHPLMESWQRVKELLIELGDEALLGSSGFERASTTYSGIEKRISEFDEIDRGSYNFRYPVDRRNGNSILSTLPDAQELHRVKETVGAIASYLGGFDTWVHEYRGQECPD